MSQQGTEIDVEEATVDDFYENEEENESEVASNNTSDERKLI